jgi:hypothetical protein
MADRAKKIISPVLGLCVIVLSCRISGAEVPEELNAKGIRLVVFLFRKVESKGDDAISIH